MPYFKKGEVVFITGASSGIGAAMAREFARQGAQVAMAARRLDRLEAVRRQIVALGGVALPVACDVTRRDSVDEAVAETLSVLGRIDIGVANAGFGVSGPAHTLDTDDYRRQFDTNFFGVLDTVHALLPHLRASRGRLALLGSVMGRMGMPAAAPYTASKYAVVGLAESLYIDLAPLGVSVTLVNPGIVESEIRSVNNRGEYTGKPDPVPGWITMPSDTAARHIVRAVYKRRGEYVVTAHGKAMVFIARHFPRLTRNAFRIAVARRGGPADSREQAKKK